MMHLNCFKMRRSILHIILFHIVVAFLIVHLPVLSQRIEKQLLDPIGFIPHTIEGKNCRTEDGGDGVCRKSEDCETLKEIRIQETCGYINSTPIICCPMKYLMVIVFAGIRAGIKEFPYMAALAYRILNYNTQSPQYRYTCGGSLISPRHVLTAAHCIKPKDGSVLHHVLLGAIDLINPDDNAQRIRIDRTVSHPQYKFPLVYNDVAVLILKSNAAINSLVKPIRFHVRSLQSTSTTGKKFQAVGFGVTEEEELSTALLKTHDLGILPPAECQRWYSYDMYKVNRGIDNTLFCARDVNTSRNSDTCTGDSGGPLIMTDAFETEPSVLVGLTNFGQDCGNLAPGVYAAVYPYLDWIDSILWMN